MHSRSRRITHKLYSQVKMKFNVSTFSVWIVDDVLGFLSLRQNIQENKLKLKKAYFALQFKVTVTVAAERGNWFTAQLPSGSRGQ